MIKEIHAYHAPQQKDLKKMKEERQKRQLDVFVQLVSESQNKAIKDGNSYTLDQKAITKLIGLNEKEADPRKFLKDNNERNSELSFWISKRIYWMKNQKKWILNDEVKDKLGYNAGDQLEISDNPTSPYINKADEKETIKYSPPKEITIWIKKGEKSKQINRKEEEKDGLLTQNVIDSQNQQSRVNRNGGIYRQLNFSNNPADLNNGNKAILEKQNLQRTLPSFNGVLGMPRMLPEFNQSQQLSRNSGNIFKFKLIIEYSYKLRPYPNAMGHHNMTQIGGPQYYFPFLPSINQFARGLNNSNQQFYLFTRPTGPNGSSE